jgi:hypothetical protein
MNASGGGGTAALRALGIAAGATGSVSSQNYWDGRAPGMPQRAEEGPCPPWAKANRRRLARPCLPTSRRGCRDPRVRCAACCPRRPPSSSSRPARGAGASRLVRVVRPKVALRARSAGSRGSTGPAPTAHRRRLGPEVACSRQSSAPGPSPPGRGLTEQSTASGPSRRGCGGPRPSAPGPSSANASEHARAAVEEESRGWRGGPKPADSRPGSQAGPSWSRAGWIPTRARDVRCGSRRGARDLPASARSRLLLELVGAGQIRGRSESICPSPRERESELIIVSS